MIILKCIKEVEGFFTEGRIYEVSEIYDNQVYIYDDNMDGHIVADMRSEDESILGYFEKDEWLEEHFVYVGEVA